MDEPILSIVIPCYNDGHFLLEAVESAQIKNGRNNHEIIIVNDGSTDKTTLDILDKMAHGGLRVVHQNNQGLGASRNTGIRAACGRYILALDADNRIKSEYIDRSIDIFEDDPNIDVVYADLEYFGGKTGRKFVPDFNLRRLLTWNYIDACAVFRKSAWEQSGGYDEKMPSQGFEDWDLWCRMAFNGASFYHINEALFEYRVRNDSMSSTMATPEKMAAILSYMRNKRVTVTLGDCMDRWNSWDYTVDQLQSQPFKNSMILLALLVIPEIYARWQLRRQKP